MMKYFEVESSNIEKVGHDSKDEILEITFLSGGVYWYQSFTTTDLQFLLEADSQGKHFHKAIKDKFTFINVTHMEQDVEFEAIYIANARLIGKPGYYPFSTLCEMHGWDFMETWDKTLRRTFWYNRQNDEYKLAVEEAITRLGE